MLGMDPVLSGSLCFLVLAIVMYVKFIREHPLSEEEINDHKTRPVEPDTVPFLHPVSPVKVMQQQKKQSPLRHHGLQVLDKAHQYKNQTGQHYPGYLQAKQPMRRRAHSASVNANNTGMTSATAVDPEMGLAKPMEAHPTIYEASGYDPNASALYPPSSGRRHHKIDFESGFGEDVEASFPTPQRLGGELRSVPFEDPPANYFDVEEGAKPIKYTNIEFTPPPAPFIMGDQFREDQQDALDTAATKPTIARQFVRSMPQPAQMQLEVARRARIPLFLHSPMYVKTSAPMVDDQAAMVEMAEQQQALAHGNHGAGAADELGATMTPRKKEKLPPKCKNNSLHIDFSELKLAEMIGQGAFGTVHRATWRGTPVAVKILVCQYLTADILEEFETEVQIMSILRHPNICLLMGACMEPPTRCLVIEYLPRGSLWNVLRQDVVIDYAKQMSFARDTALGMNYLHSFQPPILHRDLKSPNLLVDTSYAIKISDFGLARVRAHFQTMTGNCGTTQWMAPEVLAAEKYTEKADVFSFGVVCWETITRACPYDGLCQIQAALGVLNNNLRPTIPADCPPLLKKLMTLCWVSTPEKRPTFEAILEMLQSNDSSAVPSTGEHDTGHHHHR
ncbi:TPA: hypothetical protein N0F65_004046 [Lagenidium giganteum]|uniref:non-specific serine/threonine protein kinase n=1 Tax=Lagenidium giganteum TaxID=4803 RepID=A0AAV2Z1Z6_9STRA|nr:TPA: hypothetical protein N0F65_004046 [Lagenidium giganteum]